MAHSVRLWRAFDNAYNRPAWLDAGFAHWWERRENGDYDTYCYTESREVGHFGRGRWRPRIRRLLATGRAPDFPELRKESARCLP